MNTTASTSGGGRTRITARAIERVTAAVTGEALGSPGDRVRVTLTDHDGALDVAVATGIQSISLTRAMAEPRALSRSGGTVLDRTAEAERTIRDRVLALTGRTVRHVDVHLTALHIRQEARVR